MDSDIEIVRGLHEAILIFQRRMRRARLDYDLPIGRDNAILLSMLSRNANLNAGKIVSILGVTKAKVSRLLFSLEESGYIKTETSLEDRRKRDIVFTDQGREILDVMIKCNNEITLRGMHPASSSEFELTEKVIRELNDALDFPEIEFDIMESPLPIQQRRLASYSGMVGDNYMNLGFDIYYMQTLFELSRRVGEVRYSDLDSVMPFHKTRLSSILANMEEQGYLQKSSLSNDKRGLSCQLTKKGRSYYDSVEANLAKRYLPILKKVTKKEISSFVKLIKNIEKFPIPLPYQSEVEFRICKSEEDYKSARAILMELLVQQGKHRNMPSDLISKKCLSGIFHSNSKDIGVLVLGPSLDLQYFETVYVNQDQASLRDHLYSFGMQELNKITSKKSRKS